MPATLAFYRLLGLEIPEAAVWSVGGAAHHVEIKVPGASYIELDSIALTKAFDPGWQQIEGQSRNVIMFSLPTRVAVDEVYAMLMAAGHPSHLAPFDAFWGARYAIVYDPDGNQVGLISPADGAHGSAPPPL